MNDYFKKDEYWKEHINKNLEEDLWIRDYKEYFKGGKCLDLGCGIGQFSKELMTYGYDVTSADISEIALNKVNEFNLNTIRLDMSEPLPFEDDTFDLVFANLSIHYFSDADTIKLMKEIKRILKEDGLFIGSVNGIEGYESIKETAITLDHHFYSNKNKYIRLFDEEDLINYLNVFKILDIVKRETVRFNHTKNYLIFFASKNKYFQDIDNPKYLFHGSPIKLDKLELKLSHDDMGNTSNEDLAIFLTPSFLTSTSFALKKGFNEDIDSSKESYFTVSFKQLKYPYATIKNRKLKDDVIGYVHVFLKDDTMIKDNDSYQYRCYHQLNPIDVLEVKLKDYKKYYKIEDDK